MNAVEMLGITKRFNGVPANDNVDFYVEKGEIHSLLGENGAGKTTLMNILFGMYRADSGIIKINGNEVRITSPRTAIENGISMVHQHFMLVDSLTVTENIVLGQEPKKGPFFDLEGAFRQIGELADRYHFKVDPRARIRDLSVGVRQRVEILKALYHQAEILILDEPTAVLTPQEVDDLFTVLKGLKADGKTVIIITHKLKETIAVADSVTILRKGRKITRLPISEVDEQKLADLMVGRFVDLGIRKKDLRADRPVKISLEDIVLKKNGRNVLDHVSLEMRSGEILGIAGVEGNGQTELIEVITGIERGYTGKMTLDGNDITGTDASGMLKVLGHIPEDRGMRGYISSFTNWENLILGYHTLPQYMTGQGLLRTKQIRGEAEKAIEDYDIRTEGIDQLTGSLSGGNQQKLIVGRALKHHNGVLVAAQPTRGVDIGAIEYIHSQLMDVRDKGGAVILISADLDEIVKLSDRIAVIYEGRIAACRPASGFTESELGAYMLGKMGDSDEE
ncbi:MAG: ABC transporter ATP-binding protein [Oscillospiraceae bacterium]|nr:ABC transporter ATP-binding protein [Oscillospiraceae bacterium]